MGGFGDLENWDLVIAGLCGETICVFGVVRGNERPVGSGSSNGRKEAFIDRHLKFFG
jgi:hypothetical protein